MTDLHSSSIIGEILDSFKFNRLRSLDAIWSFPTMGIICPKCHGMNVRQVSKPKKTRYGRIHRKFQCKDCGHYWIERR